MVILITGSGLFLILVTSCFYLAYYRRIFPGISVADYPIGNQNQQQAKTTLDNLVRLLPREIILIGSGQQWTINLSEIGLAYDTNQTIIKAYQIGRNGNPIQKFKTITKVWFDGINLDYHYRVDQAILENTIDNIADQIFIPTINPQLTVVEKSISVNPGQDGQELNKRGLLAILSSRFATHDFKPVTLPINLNSSIASQIAIDRTLERAEKMVNKKLFLRFEDQEWEIEKEDLVSMIAFDDGFNQEKIRENIDFLSKAIDRPPQNAVFQFKGERVTEFKPALAGQELDRETTAKKITSALGKLESEESLKKKTLDLPVFLLEPEITNDQVNHLGIKKLLGQGVSFYRGSIASRVHNLTLASSSLNGILIKPGEVFSFNQTLGEVSPATGYQSAFVIKEGKTVLDDGGGVCQVSTTFFRAALNTGLPILERHPHSYRVSYYEQGGFGPGLDATVWIPSVDLKIKNDTPGYILIQSFINPQEQSLTFEFYGTGDDRQAFISKPKIWSTSPPPPDIFQDDPTLPAGTVKQIERAVSGAKVSVDYKVTRNGETLQERTFFSNYQPWQAVYLQGTGT